MWVLLLLLSPELSVETVHSSKGSSMFTFTMSQRLKLLWCWLRETLQTLWIWSCTVGKHLFYWTLWLPSGLTLHCELSEGGLTRPLFLFGCMKFCRPQKEKKLFPNQFPWNSVCGLVLLYMRGPKTKSPLYLRGPQAWSGPKGWSPNVEMAVWGLRLAFRPQIRVRFGVRHSINSRVKS